MLRVLSNFKFSQRGRIGSTRGLARVSHARQPERDPGLARRIIQISDRMQSLTDDQLLQSARNLRAQVNRNADLDSILPDAFALVREACRRVHRQAHYEVQIAAAFGLCNGGIAEMQTGEGKTLVALLPAFLYSLLGNGLHVVTANDYLAQRDAEFAQAVFNRLGITVGCLFDGLPRHRRKAEYDRDITYATAREFGFDFLKDRLASGPSTVPALPIAAATVQRGHFFALVDEADSVLIDDARTPLLIANPSDKDPIRQDMVRACHIAALQLRSQVDFELNHDQRTSRLTRVGCRIVLRHLAPELVHGFGTDEIYRQTENSLAANYLFLVNRHYVVHQGNVAIVDESTGRIADGRQWQSGLHQAIEAKELVEITSGTRTMAKVTVQSYFRNYRHLAGLTGTAQQVAHEFKKVYNLRVTPIPTRKPSKRSRFPERVFESFSEKAQAIVTSTRERLNTGQAVLIGTPSVQESQKISAALADAGIAHHVLNCLEHKSESTIIGQAGIAGRVTVATNMAGRGTDIRVDPIVQQNGGLHVIATAKHSSSRIDRQLIGRTARQGYPGSYQFFLSLEDELLLMSGTKPAARFSRHGNPQLSPMWTRVFDQAQSNVERRHEKQRLNLLAHETRRHQLCLQMGLDPCLEMLDE